MRLTGSGTYSRAAPVPRMPPGLVELMEGLSKDVLRNNPTNIYEFCANHMEKLIEIRDGPSARKKSLTLEEKIAVAQKKVRQRAKEQQERYDYEMLNAAMTQLEKDKSDHEAPNSSQRELLNLRSPVHHEQDLSLASEVEISHELSTDNSSTSKDCIIEADDIPISKSSTVSSISKSTVIDLLNNDQEIINKEDMENDNGLNLLNEDVAQNENPDESIQRHESHISDAIDQNVLIETPIIPDEEISAKELDVALKKEIENKSDTLEKSKSVNRDSENQIADSGTVDDTMDTSIFVSESSPQHTEPELVDTAISECQMDDHINMDETNARVSVESTSNVTNEQPAHNQIAEVEEPLPAKTVESLEDSSLPESDNNFFTHVQFSSDISTDNSHTNENAIQVVDESSDEHTAKIGYEQSDAIKVAEIYEENEKDTKAKDQLSPKNNELEENHSTSKENQNEVGVKEIKIFNEENINNENPIQVVDESNDEHTAKIGYEQSDAIKVAEIYEENEKETNAKDQLSPKTNELEENHSTRKENQNEVGVKEFKIVNEENINKEDIEVPANDDNSLIKDRRESTGNDNMDKNHFDVEQKDETKNKNEITTLILNPDSVDNDGSNSIVSDLSKTEEGVPQNDNENVHNNMDLETAAVTIQKVFRSFLFKSRNSTFEDITNDEAIPLDEDNDKKEEYYAAAANLNQDRRPLGLTRMDTVLQTVNEEKSLSLSTDDSSTLSSAATTIQAHVRGFLVRNRLNSYKTVSTNSLVNSNEMLDTDSDQKSKTVLNIHIVPEQANYLSRDESLITSMDLSLDGSPPSSVNLHPLSYDLVSERRKLLKREDAIQSVSPPSNNSGKLSEDSVKEVLVNENDATKIDSNLNEKEDQPNAADSSGGILTAVADVTVDDTSNEPVDVEIIVEKRKSPMSPDESDVVTPFAASQEMPSPHSVGAFENTSRLLHSGEFHDVLLPTKVSRSDTTVVREFKNVLAYILLWNAS